MAMSEPSLPHPALAPPSWRARLSRFVSEYWLVALALHPLVRFVLLTVPGGGLQQAERFYWLSFWPIEIAVILAAAWRGFDVLRYLRTLPTAIKALAGVWVFALAASSVIALIPSLAMLSSVQWLVHGGFIISAWYLFAADLQKSGDRFRRFALLMPIVTAFVGLCGMAAVYRIGLDSGFPFLENMPGFAHLRHTGYIFAPAMALCLGMLAIDRQRSWLWMVLLAANSLFCLWFGSRGPVLGLMIGAPVCFFLFASFRRLPFLGMALAASLVGAGLSLAIPSPPGGFNALDRAAQTSSGGAHAISHGRTDLWVEALSLIKQRPVLGYGGGQFQSVSTHAANSFRHPHDFALQAIFDWGLVGGGAFLTMVGLALAAATRHSRMGSDLAPVALLGALAMIGLALIDGVFFYNYTAMLALIFLAYPIALPPQQQRV